DTGEINDLLYLNNTNGGGNAAGMTFAVTGTDRATMYAYDSSLILRTQQNIPMIFGTNDTERMRITGAGDVGIGNDTPAEALDVTGNIAVSGMIRVGGTAGDAPDFF